MITDIDIFKEIKHCLLEQNEQSIDESGECAYRGFLFDEDHHAPIKELKCAIGHIIDDKYYWEGLEGKGPGDYQVIEAVRNSNPSWSLDDNSRDMITKLQVVHDVLIPEMWSLAFDGDHWIFDNDGKFLGVLASIVDKFSTLLRSDAFNQKVYLNRNGISSMTKDQLV